MSWWSRAGRPRLATVLPCALLLAVWGCGGSGSANLVPVSGKVLAGGKALTRGTVSFRPDKSRKNLDTAEPSGEIGPDGTYTLYTNKKAGAPPGKYFVLVEASEAIDPKNPSATPKSLIDPKWADAER